MRAFFLDTHPSASKRRALLFAALLLAAICALALTEASAPAETPQEKLEATQGKLEGVRADQSALAETIAEQNAAIDSMIGEVSALRQKQAAVEAELAEKQAELDAGDGGAGEGKGAPRRGPRPAAAAPSASCASAWSRSTRPARPTSSTRSSNRRTGPRWRPRPNT